MFVKQVELTSANRPDLLPDETLLLVQDSVGLYEGKWKIPEHQQGHAYLTTHRACYVDDADPRQKSVALELKDVDRGELQAGFLRSSAKVTLFPKPPRHGAGPLPLRLQPSRHAAPSQYSSLGSSPVSRTSSPLGSLVAPAPTRQTSGTWICPICSFSNPVPVNFDPGTATAAFPLPPCQACGIKPPFTHVLKAAISAASSNWGLRPSQASLPASFCHENPDPPKDVTADDDTTVTCARCTFHNHPSLLSCEVCGAPLVSSSSMRPSADELARTRAASPGPQMEGLSLDEAREPESIKFSFRAGGEKVFYERLKGALIQRKWLSQRAPPPPRPEQSPGPDRNGFQQGILTPERAQPSPVGIAGLEQRGITSRKNNELVIGSAFEDLEALMASAKDIVALAEKFASESGSSTEAATALGMTTTKDLLVGGSDSLYISELSRNLAEYLTDDRKGILLREGGIMSLVDLWAVFNSSRNGVELISPTDFEKAAKAWETLGMPVRLRQFKSDLLVVQGLEWSDERVISRLKAWLQELRVLALLEEGASGVDSFGQAVTAQKAAQRFGWSVGVASEELEMAEDHGVLCREEGIEGLSFWENHLLSRDDEGI